MEILPIKFLYTPQPYFARKDNGESSLFSKSGFSGDHLGGMLFSPEGDS
jgi:hypothetical protein